MPDQASQKRAEICVFLLLVVAVAPTLAVAGVGGYGLLVLILELLG